MNNKMNNKNESTITQLFEHLESLQLEHSIVVDTKTKQSVEKEIEDVKKEILELENKE